MSIIYDFMYNIISYHWKNQFMKMIGYVKDNEHCTDIPLHVRPSLILLLLLPDIEDNQQVEDTI